MAKKEKSRYPSEARTVINRARRVNIEWHNNVSSNCQFTYFRVFVLHKKREFAVNLKQIATIAKQYTLVVILHLAKLCLFVCLDSVGLWIDTSETSSGIEFDLLITIYSNTSRDKDSRLRFQWTIRMLFCCIPFYLAKTNNEPKTTSGCDPRSYQGFLTQTNSACFSTGQLFH